MYELHKPGDGSFDLEQFWAIMAFRDIYPGEKILMLPEAGKIGGERRFLYFYQALTANGSLNGEPTLNAGLVEKPPIIRIIGFGTCNVACPYCKRGCQFIDAQGNVVESVLVPIEDVARVCVGAVERGETVRFSGGDPVTYPKHTLALAEYLLRVHDHKVSIAHNGSGPSWVGRMKTYLSSAAIDLKGVPEKMGYIMGIDPTRGQMRYDSSLKSQGMLSKAGILVDVRTPIFGDTSIEEMRRLATDIVASNDLHFTFWTWRLYKAVEDCDWEVPDQQKVIEMMKAISGEFPQLWLGLRAKWEKSGMLYLRGGEVV